MVLAGQAAPEVASNRLSRAPLDGLTPFLAHHVLEARSIAGDSTGCLNLIRNYWGAMLDLGATSYWEYFDYSWLAKSGRIDDFIEDDNLES
jgi:alpha-L-rhamnosidase